MGEIRYRFVSGDAELAGAFRVRRRVFIEEQAIPEAEEWDGLDSEARHFIALNGAEVIGTARVRLLAPPQAKIERMAVLPAYRRQGVGSGLLAGLLADLGQRGVKQAVLHAQYYATPFYRANGFSEVGDIFWEAGIKHVKMTRDV